MAAVVSSIDYNTIDAAWSRVPSSQCRSIEACDNDCVHRALQRHTDHPSIFHLALEPSQTMPDNSLITSAHAVAAGVGVSRGGPGQWGFVNLVRAGTQQP